MDVKATARELFDSKAAIVVDGGELGDGELVGFFVRPAPMHALGAALVRLELEQDPALALIDAAKLKTNKHGDNIAVEIPIEAWRACYPFFEELKRREEG